MRIFARIMCPYTHINAYSLAFKPFFCMKKHGALPCFAFFCFQYAGSAINLFLDELYIAI